MARRWSWGWRRQWSRRRRWPRRSTLLIVFFAALAAAGLAWTPPPDMVTATGAVTVVDGDTFRIGRETIRLEGLDAPESRQVCTDGWPAGKAAQDALADLLWAGRPRCEHVTTDRYGRTVAVCRVNEEDIGAAMVRRGLAWAYVTYSVRYLPEELLARYDGIGVHAHVCASPADWRALHPR